MAQLSPEHVGIAPGAPPSAATDLERTTLRKVSLRLIPFLFILYVVNILDRANISIAKLQMVKDLEMSEAAYGLGAGIFYVGYLLFEVPSNLMLHRMGARAWLARILVSWGLISSAMMFVAGEWSFYAMRVLLGVAEAGFFPGVILYLSHWFPARERARAVARFMTAAVVASLLGNPLSGAILDYMPRVGGIAGWQWVFLLEGIPAIVLGFITLAYLTDRPAQAHWLTADERAWLAERMAGEENDRAQRHQLGLLASLAYPRLWLLIAVYFTVAFGDNCYGFFLPSIVRVSFPAPAWTDFHIGLVAAIPSVLAIIGMVLIGAHSDRTGERRWHVAGPAFLAAAGWLLVAFTPLPWLAVLGLALASTGMKSMLPTFWTLPTAFLSGTGAAGGIALINSVANLGGLIGPLLTGTIKDRTGSFSGALLVIAVLLVIGGVLVLCVRHEESSSNCAAALLANEEG